MAKRTFGQLVDAVVRKDYSPKDGLEDDIKEWINEGYMRISDEDLKCFRKTVTFNTVIGQHQYDMATVMPSYRKMLSIFSQSGPIEWQHISRFDYVTYGNPDLTNGNPQYAFEIDDKLNLFPVPDSVQQITARYFFIPDRLEEDADLHILPENKEELLILYAKSAYADRERDFERVEMIDKKFERELFKWTVKNQEDMKGKTDMVELQRSYKRKLARR